MVDVDELQEKELDEIQNQDNDNTDELFDLESFLLDGTDKRVPIKITYPLPDGTLKSNTAQIRPVTSAEWSNCVQKGFNKNLNTNAEVEVLKYCLYNKNGDKFNPRAIDAMATGVVSKIAKQILEISGIKPTQNEQSELISKLVGF